MTALITLNATVAEIEDLLLAGKSVKDAARDLQEPPNNVYGVYCSLVERGRIKDDSVSIPVRRDLTVASQQTTGRAGSASLRPVPAPSTSRPPVAPEGAATGSAEPTISALFNAAQRSSSARTRNLGKRLGDTADELLARLKNERETAEKAEQEREAREAAAADVARLEAALAEARAKLGKGRGGSASPQSASGRATAEKYAGRKPCEKCGKDLTTLPGPRGAHMKRCPGGAK